MKQASMVSLNNYLQQNISENPKSTIPAQPHRGRGSCLRVPCSLWGDGCPK